MDLAEDPTLPDLLKSPLWLEVRHKDLTWLFELKAGEERAVVVGSQHRADVCLARPGIASMHFHFEREGDAIMAIPGYRAELRVNSVKALEPYPIRTHATVEFCGASLEVTTHRQRPSHLELTAYADRSSGLDYLQSLPENTDPTGIAATAVSGVSPVSQDTLQVVRAAFVTERIVREPAADADRAVTQPAPRGPVLGAPLGPQGTVIMSRAELRVPEGELAEPSPWSQAHLGNTEPIPMAALAIEARSERAATPDSTPTRIESPAARRSKPPGPAAPAPAPVEARLSPVPNQPTVLPAQPPSSQQTTDFDVAAVAPFFVTPPSGILNRAAPAAPPVATEATPPASVRAASTSTASVSRTIARAPLMPPQALLAALGNAARKSPLLVAAGALSGAVILTLALIGASRLLPMEPSQRPAGPVAEASAAPPSVAPAAALTPTVAIATPIATASAQPLTSSVTTPTSAVPPGGATGLSKADPDVAQAVGHLVAGRLAEAQLAYSRLAAREPQNAAYAAISRMLDQRSTAPCSQKQPAKGCPEVRP